MSIKNELRALSLISLTSIASAASAVASEQPNTQEDKPRALEEVVVTANKREESLSKVPLAVSAVSPEQMTAAGVIGLKDLTSLAPNVEMKFVGIANSVQVAIRGITNSDFNQLGDPAVASYVDGVYIGRPQGLFGDLYDLQRIEVLRGPQGTLYGRNATGGNINVITADPKSVFGASANVSYGNYNDMHVDGMVNLPLTDTLAIRGAVIVHTNDGYFDTRGTTKHNYGRADNVGGRLTALWTPSDTFKWRLSAEMFSARGTPSLSFDTGPDGSPADGLPVFNRPVSSFPEPKTEIDNVMVRSRMDWQMSDNASITYIAGYQDITYNTLFATTGPVFDGSRNNDSDSSSHEIDLNFSAGPVDNILGATYFELENYNNDGYHLYTLGMNFGANDDISTKAWGVFDQLTYNVTDELRLIAGVRYSSERKYNRGDVLEFCPQDQNPNMPFEPILALYEGPGCFPASQATARGEWSNVDWKAGVQYDFSELTTSYFSVTTGFKSGGLNPGVGAFPSFEPEQVTSYELGAKSRRSDDGLSGSATLFYQDYTDLQVTQLASSLNGQVQQITDNAAGADIYGIELEGQWRVTDRGALSGYFNYLSATYSDYKNAVDEHTGIGYPSLDDNRLPHAPEFSARLQYSHDFALSNGASLSPMAAIYWQSKTYLRGFNLPIDEVGDYTKTTVSLAYASADERWRVTGYVDNLEDETVRNSGFPVVGSYFSDYSPPRTYGVRLSYQY